MRIHDYPLLLTGEQVAEIMNISTPTAYKYMNNRLIPTVKMPGKKGAVRVMRDQLYAWMIEQSGQGA